MKVFILGATGYIGGDALYAIANAYPEYDITALVRTSEKGALVASEYPKIKLVYGDTNASDVIKEEVHKADVVLHFAESADDVPGTTTITSSLHTRPNPTKPIYYIHTSGTGVLTYKDQDLKSYGQESQKIYNDWDGISELTSLPDHAPHRNVDKLVLDAGALNPGVVKTAIVCPPCIYGPGRGPGNKTSLQVPILSALTLQKGHGIQVGEGKTHWNQVHVQDLSNVYVALVEAAAAGRGKATWGAEGYYFAENGDMVWGEVAKWIVAAAKKHGLVKGDEIVSYDYEEIDKLQAFGSYMWGASSRSHAIRARNLLGWEPRMPGLKDTVEEAVVVEAKKLGKLPGHAKVAAGDA